MNNWKETILGEVVDKANTGADAIKRAPIVVENTGIKCLRIQDISQKKSYSDWGFTSVSENVYNKFQLKAGDLMVARTGASIGVNKLIKKDLKAVFNNGLIRIKLNNKALSEYVYFLLSSKRFAHYILSISQGTSTQPNIQINALLDFPLILPPPPEQKSIANTLSSFDNKIMLLQNQNQTLENIAQTFFKYWFIDFEFPNKKGRPYKSSCGKMFDSEFGKIPEKWSPEKIGDYINICGGGTPSTKNALYWNGDIYWTSPKDLSNGQDYFLIKTEKKITEKGLKKISSEILPKGTLLLSSRAPIGYLAITSIPVAINQGYIAFKPDGKLSNVFMYLWLKYYIRRVEASASGSTFLEISKRSFRDIETIIPKKEVLIAFDRIVVPIFDKIKNNIFEIQTLSRLRDTLLPKLTSGELRVK